MSQRDLLQLHLGRKPDRLIIVFLGFIDTGRSLQTFLNALSPYGNVLMVSYPRDGFDAKAIAKEVTEYVACMPDPIPTEVVLVGASMGARVALEALSEMLLNGSPVRGFIAISGVAETKSITDGNRQLLELSLRGQGRKWLETTLFSGLMTYIVIPLIDAANVWARLVRHGRITVSQGVSRSELRRNLWAMRFVSWRARLGQARYLASLSDLAPKLYAVTPLVYIQTSSDEFVKAQAATAYLRHFSDNGSILQTMMPHCSFVERRPVWEDTLKRALALLLVSTD